MIVLACDDVAARVINAGVPILFLDTCIVLDIVRAPIREAIGVHDIAAVHTLIERATRTPPEVSLVINQQVHGEFLTNIDEVEKDVVRSLKTLGDQLSGVLTRMSALCSTVQIPGNVNLLSLGFPKIGRQLADKLLQSSIVLEDHEDELRKALHRVNFAHPPATQAKQSFKDCLIIESYLRLAGALQTAGCFYNKVFATSNTKDYQQGHSALHPHLVSEFSAFDLEYSPCWSAARHELDR